jgi:DNA repair exonuclease SbcCD ATPase subunit
MLQLNLEYFQCWKQLSLSFHPKSVVLIKGPSGSGKTTIFNAITWCLYKISRHVAPLKLPNANTSVSMKIPIGKGEFLCIQRTKKKISVSIGENVHLEGLPAQKLIEERLGDYDTWIMTSYIAQKSKNNFFMESVAGKLSFLHSIAFYKEDPSIFVGKIKQVVDEKQAVFKAKNATFVERMEKSKGVLDYLSIASAISEDIFLETKTLLIEAKIEIKNNMSKNIAYNVQKKELSRILERKKSLEEELEYIKKPILDKETKLFLKSTKKNTLLEPKDIVLLWKQILEYIVNIETISKKVNKMEPLNDAYNLDCIYTMEDYSRINQIEKTIHSDKQKIKHFGIPYHQDAILAYVQEKKNLLASIESLEVKERYLEYNRRIASLDKKIKELEEINKKLEENNNSIANDIKKYARKKEMVQETLEPSKNTIHQTTNKKNKLERDLFKSNEEYKKYNSILSCPECKSYLSYTDETLCKHDANVIHAKKIELEIRMREIKEKIQECEVLVSKEQEAYDTSKTKLHHYEEKLSILSYKQKDGRKREIENKKINEKTVQEKIEIEQSIKNLPPFSDKELENIPVLSKKEINALKLSIYELSTIQVLATPIHASSVIKASIEQQALLETKKHREDKLTHIRSKIPTWFPLEKETSLMRYIEIYSIYLEEKDTFKKQYKKCKQEKLELEEEVVEIIKNEIGDPSKELEMLEKNIEIYEERITDYEKQRNASIVKESLLKERQELLTLNHELSVYYTLQKQAVQLEHDMLKTTIDTINTSIETMCESLFDKDIVGHIKLYKENKATKIVKPTVTFTVSMDGKKYDNFSQISGGETDRISIALSVAFQKISSFNWILLLDETLSGIDSDATIKTIKTLKENTNSTVLVISQGNIVEGLFDDVIHVEDYISGSI